jgi:glutathione S-transferase
MAYTLFGSKTSPFVRRIRLLMENTPYEFKELNIFETEDAITLNKMNPVNQIPVLLDGDRRIWDSRQIFNYLNIMHKLHNMTWEDENTLTALDGAMNSGVALLLMKRSGLNIDEPYMYMSRQKERVDSVIQYMTPYMRENGLKEWNFITMTLYSFLDWANFREIISLKMYPDALTFLEAHSNRTIVQNTMIPKV